MQHEAVVDRVPLVKPDDLLVLHVKIQVAVRAWLQVSCTFSMRSFLPVNPVVPLLAVL